MADGEADRSFAALRVGDAATFGKTIAEADVALFASLSGDAFPIHVDEEYARATRYGRRVVHGMLSASLLSTANGRLLGSGGIYVEQTLRFTRPVFLGDTLTARAEIIELLPQRHRLRCRTTVTNQHGKVVVDGESLLQKD